MLNMIRRYFETPEQKLARGIAADMAWQPKNPRPQVEQGTGWMTDAEIAQEYGSSRNHWGNTQ